MSRMRTILAGLSVAAGLGIASFPVFVSAVTECETGVDCRESGDMFTTVTLSDVISMRIVSHSDSATTTTTCNSLDKTPSSDGCTGDEQSTLTNLLPNDSNITGNTSTAYSYVYVSTNSPNGYTLTLIDTDENTNLVNAAGQTISAINSTPVAGSNPGWAVAVNGGSWQIMKHNKNSSGTIPAETPITVKTNVPTSSGTMTSLITDDQSTVYYGYATSSTQATGLYTDTIEYTATTL